MPSLSSCPPHLHGHTCGPGRGACLPLETPGQDCASPLQVPQGQLYSPNFSPPLGAHTSVLSHLRLGQSEHGQVDMGGNGGEVSPHFSCEPLSPKVRGCPGWGSLALLLVGPAQGTGETTSGETKNSAKWGPGLGESCVCRWSLPTV